MTFTNKSYTSAAVVMITKADDFVKKVKQLPKKRENVKTVVLKTKGEGDNWSQKAIIEEVTRIMTGKTPKVKQTRYYRDMDFLSLKRVTRERLKNLSKPSSSRTR